MATTGKASAGTSKPSEEDLLSKISEQAGTIERLQEQINALKETALMSAGIDQAVIEMRRTMKRRLVQFRESYGRTAKPSKTQKGLSQIERYSVKAGEIVYLPEEEIARLKDVEINRHVPEKGTKKGKLVPMKLIETDEKEFAPMIWKRWKWEPDSTGIPRPKEETGETPVKDLIASAREVG